MRIAFYSRDVPPCRQCFGDLAAAFHQNRVHNVKRTMLDAALTQPLENRSLCGLALVPQRLIDVAAFFSFCLQGGGLA
jgi:hypothetical protein